MGVRDEKWDDVKKEVEERRVKDERLRQELVEKAKVTSMECYASSPTKV